MRVNSNVISIKATADLKANTFVSCGGAVCESGMCAGVCVCDTDSNEFAPIAIGGKLEVVASGAIAIGDAVSASTDGKAKEAGANDTTVGYALTASTADGDVIELILK